ncbi:hypothetical protein C3L33_06491, partial [Rhododendron williamsianum]
MSNFYGDFNQKIDYVLKITRPGFHYVVLSSPYPPGPSSSAHQRSAVYVGVLNKDDLTEWYSFAINGAEKPYERNRGRTGLDDDGIPVVAPINTKRLSNSSSCAAVDSTIYCIGGTSSDLYASRLYYRKVRRWDTNSVSPGEQSQPWVRSTPMKVARCLAEAVALNGKIYVMGGVNNDEGGPEPWAEVFDPQSGKWVSLDPPSPKPTSSGLFSATLPAYDKLLLGSCHDDFLYLYHTLSNHWEKLHHEMDFRPWHKRPVVVGTRLLWFQYGNLYAYDLFDKWNFSTSIRGLERVVPLETFDPDSGDQPVLLHIAGNNFCLLCLEYVNTKRRLVLLHFIKFCVSDFVVRGSKIRFDASVETSQAYFIQMPQMNLDAVVL